MGVMDSLRNLFGGSKKDATASDAPSATDTPAAADADAAAQAEAERVAEELAVERVQHDIDRERGMAADRSSNIPSGFDDRR
jgi:hypothetical protein